MQHKSDGAAGPVSQQNATPFTVVSTVPGGQARVQQMRSVSLPIGPPFVVSQQYVTPLMTTGLLSGGHVDDGAAHENGPWTSVGNPRRDCAPAASVGPFTVKPQPVPTTFGD